ncbi:MAG: PAM68 family protein [Kaiparowitsia implicata GSE-PSE-MK54-09C]|nr:PAM68 family protein [Kaiparowitsia implicata GSE-PSE-MK54-09C]
MASPSPSESNNQSPERASIPFEPKRRKPAEKQPKRSASPSRKDSPVPGAKSAASPVASRSSGSGIPEVVSNRMLKRMAIFCGAPTALGVSSFFISYFLVTQGINLPHVAVLLVSLGCFGLGVVGLSYGALSTSWDETETGSLLGIPEFRLNVRRMVSAWRANGDSTPDM